MKKYSDKNIFELMKIPTNELKELSVEKFIKKIVGKKVSVFPSSNNGDLVISVTSADISIRDRKIVFKDYPHFQIELAEKTIFGIYSYGDNENYRIALEGNNPDLLLTIPWWNN